MTSPPAFVVRAVVAGSHALRRLADKPVPLQGRMMDLAGGHCVTRMAATFTELGVAEELDDRAMTARELAPLVGADPEALHRLLRALSAYGVVHMRHDGRVSLTPLGRTLRADHPSSIREWVLYQVDEASVRAWSGLTESIRTGEPAFPRENGASLWVTLAERPEAEQLFAGAMQRVTDFTGPAVAAAYEWPPGATVCDLGGGVGTLLTHILLRDPTLRGVLVDGPGPLAQAPAFLSGRGFADRVRLVEGDLFGDLDVEADIYVLKSVLHDWDDERSVRILRNVAGTMPADARLLLAELLQEPNAPHPLVPLSDLRMLTQTDGGRERRVAEFEALLHESGLRLRRVIRGPLLSVLETELA